ncbi:unnamed protein product [Closterium sp. NIES-65]|nr:unnamed protein product [Closterium sp. NIES-65]
MSWLRPLAADRCGVLGCYRKQKEQISAYRDRRFRGTQEEFEQALRVSTTVYVGNLSFYTTEEQIYEVFSKAGEIRRIVMGLDKNTMTPCGFCFVAYYVREDAEDAVKYVSSTILDDRPIRVDFDWGYEDGRQWGRGRSGGQVRDEYRTDYDPDMCLSRLYPSHLSLPSPSSLCTEGGSSHLAVRHSALHASAGRWAVTLPVLCMPMLAPLLPSLFPSPPLPSLFPSPPLPSLFPSPPLPSLFPSPPLPSLFPSPPLPSLFPSPPLPSLFPSPPLPSLFPSPPLPSLFPSPPLPSLFPSPPLPSLFPSPPLPSLFPSPPLPSLLFPSLPSTPPSSFLLRPSSFPFVLSTLLSLPYCMTRGVRQATAPCHPAVRSFIVPLPSPLSFWGYGKLVQKEIVAIQQYGAALVMPGEGGSPLCYGKLVQKEIAAIQQYGAPLFMPGEGGSPGGMPPSFGHSPSVPRQPMSHRMQQRLGNQQGPRRAQRYSRDDRQRGGYRGKQLCL